VDFIEQLADLVGILLEDLLDVRPEQGRKAHSGAETNRPRAANPGASLASDVEVRRERRLQNVRDYLVTPGLASARTRGRG
jgi:hypothetical protein